MNNTTTHIPKNELIDNGVCPKCGGKLKVESENVGHQEYPKIELTIKCTKCEHEPTRD